MIRKQIAEWRQNWSVRGQIFSNFPGETGLLVWTDASSNLYEWAKRKLLEAMGDWKTQYAPPPRVNLGSSGLSRIWQDDAQAARPHEGASTPIPRASKAA